MDQEPLNEWTVVFDRPSWDLLQAHLFPGDDDEHGAVLGCGVAETPRGRRLLVREVLPARDGADYIRSPRAYRMLTADFVAQAVDHCARNNLVYLAAHNHSGRSAVEFSAADLRSHERGYPALLNITRGGPVGALVLAEGAVAGDIWEPTGRAAVARTVVLGSRREILLPRPRVVTGQAVAMFDRQARLFGDEGQRILRDLKVGIVGAGGAGSMLNQALAHVGVGELVALDDDVIEVTNLPRVVGSAPLDAASDDPAWPGTAKVELSRRLALAVNPALRYHAVRDSVVDEAAARHLIDCDVLFLAADSMQARHVVNAIAHQYLIPCFQVGAKVQVADGRVVDAFAVSRAVGPGGLCLWCQGLVSPTRLAEEAHSPEERRAMQYVEGVPQPSVITMNAMSTALALNDFLFMVTGLHETNDLAPRRYHFLTREPVVESSPVGKVCDECGRAARGRRGLGDRRRLPLRMAG